MIELMCEYDKYLSQLNLTLSDHQKKQFSDYLNLLLKWNKTYNLTSITKPEDIILKHFCDSLSVAPYINAWPLLDVGTGGGFPGVPLALFYPGKEVTLLDKSVKKIRFLQHIKQVLGLECVEVLNARVQDHQQNKKFKTIISRAFSSPKDMVQMTQHLCEEGGRILCMKGAISPSDEKLEVSGFKTLELISLSVPGCTSRHLLIFEKIK